MKKYAVCGVSNRAMGMFIKPLLEKFSETCQLVALLDHDHKRFRICKERFSNLGHVPEFNDHEFDKMIQETCPDVIIVASRDDTHVDYILKGFDHGLDVITEKPMVTTAKDSKKIMEAEALSSGKLTVAFNYRYSPYHMKIKEMILAGKIGKVTSIDLNWYIDTFHGSSYFKRWNRKRDYSGGLSIHKSSHHFDLINWWTNQKPVEVFAYGDLHYYGIDGEMNPEQQDGRFCGTCQIKSDCMYYKRWNSRSNDLNIQDDHIRSKNQDENMYTNYRPDQCIFDSEIDIEDTYTAVVKYDQGALLSYSVNFSLPYEGYRLAINGTKGRIETMEYHSPSRVPFSVPEQTIDYFPLFGSKETIHVVKREGGHGGGDPVIQEDIFLGPDPERPYSILSGSMDGAYAVATGEGVWRSVQENRPIHIDAILGKKETAK